MFPKSVLNSTFSKRNAAALDGEIFCQDADPNKSEVVEVKVPIRVYWCWNCEEEGHGWDMCMKERKVFCYS